MKKWLPRKGQVFDDRESLLDRLLNSGWDFEGQGTALDEGDITGYDVGVTDKKQTVWIMVEMKPVVRVTRIKRMKLPYRG